MIYTATYVATTGQNIGSLTDFTAQGRFKFTRREQVRYILASFSGGSGVADLLLYRHKRLDGASGAKLIWGEAGRGTGYDATIAIPPGEPRESLYLMDVAHDLLLLWTNPDGSNMKWLVEVHTELR